MKNKTTSLLILILGLLPVAALAHPKELKPEFVDTLVPAYLEIQSALAADNPVAAKAAAQALLDASAQGPGFAPLTDAAEQIIAADDIKSVRQHFQVLSDEMIGLVEHVGTSGTQDLHVAHCPMAFGGKGGDWLQTGKKIRNPYYGAMMLSCGTIKK